jgi:nicotinamidase-related amidase
MTRCWSRWPPWYPVWPPRPATARLRAWISTSYVPYRRVLVCGADTDACVLGVALGLFDAGVPVEVVTDLCLSAGGPQAHQAGLVVLRRQLGTSRMTTSAELMGLGGGPE